MGPARQSVLRQVAGVMSCGSREEPSVSVALVASDHPSASLSPRVSLTAGGGLPRQALIDTLRTRIEAIVPRADHGRSLAKAPTPQARGRASACSFSHETAGRPWTLGIEDIDRFLPDRGLAPGGLHEVKPASAADAPAAQTLGLALMARRLRAAPPRARLLLWAATWRDIGEAGRPYGPGLAALGLNPAHVILIEARRDSEVLWAIEEGLRAGALAGVVGSVAKLGLTAARRLALAAATHETPCLLLTPATLPGVPVAMSRWRVGASPGGSHALEAGLPGERRFHLTLERCRGREAGRSWIVEWSDASFRFRLATPLADRASRPGVTRRRAG